MNGRQGTLRIIDRRSSSRSPQSDPTPTFYNNVQSRLNNKNLPERIPIESDSHYRTGSVDSPKIGIGRSNPRESLGDLTSMSSISTVSESDASSLDISRHSVVNDSQVDLLFDKRNKLKSGIDQLRVKFNDLNAEEQKITGKAPPAIQSTSYEYSNNLLRRTSSASLNSTNWKPFRQPSLVSTQSTASASSLLPSLHETTDPSTSNKGLSIKNLRRTTPSMVAFENTLFQFLGSNGKDDEIARLLNPGSTWSESDFQRAEWLVEIKRLETDRQVLVELYLIHKEKSKTNRADAYRLAYKTNLRKIKDIDAQLQRLRQWVGINTNASTTTDDFCQTLQRHRKHRRRPTLTGIIKFKRRLSRSVIFGKGIADRSVAAQLASSAQFFGDSTSSRQPVVRGASAAAAAPSSRRSIIRRRQSCKRAPLVRGRAINNDDTESIQSGNRSSRIANPRQSLRVNLNSPWQRTSSKRQQSVDVSKSTNTANLATEDYDSDQESWHQLSDDRLDSASFSKSMTSVHQSGSLSPRSRRLYSCPVLVADGQRIPHSPSHDSQPSFDKLVRPTNDPRVGIIGDDKIDLIKTATNSSRLQSEKAEAGQEDTLGTSTSLPLVATRSTCRRESTLRSSSSHPYLSATTESNTAPAATTKLINDDPDKKQLSQSVSSTTTNDDTSGVSSMSSPAVSSNASTSGSPYSNDPSPKSRLEVVTPYRSDRSESPQTVIVKIRPNAADHHQHSTKTVTPIVRQKTMPETAEVHRLSTAAKRQSFGAVKWFTMNLEYDKDNNDDASNTVRQIRQPSVRKSLAPITSMFKRVVSKATTTKSCDDCDLETTVGSSSRDNVSSRFKSSAKSFNSSSSQERDSQLSTATAQPVKPFVNARTRLSNRFSRSRQRQDR